MAVFYSFYCQRQDIYILQPAECNIQLLFFYIIKRYRDINEESEKIDPIPIDRDLRNPASIFF